MKATYDQDAGCGYVQVSNNNAMKTVEVSANLVCDLDDSGTLVGLEMIDCDENYFQKFCDELSRITYEGFSAA